MNEAAVWISLDVPADVYVSGVIVRRYDGWRIGKIDWVLEQAAVEHEAGDE